METVAAEWRLRDLGEPIRQGDIFEWRISATSDAWQRLGIVVTADCDLAQNKHRDVLTYCPVLTLPDYLREVWLPTDLARARAAHAARVAERVTAARRKHRPEYDAALEPSVLVGWLERRGVAGLADDAGIPPGKSRVDIEQALRVLQLLSDEANTNDIGAMVAAIARARAGDDMPSPEELRKKLEDVVRTYRDRVRGLAGDLFFLNELSPDHHDGYIVALRHLREIGHNVIAVRPADTRHVPARRISRLRAPFRYRLTQKLAAVFSDIGLPGEYEERCSTTIGNLTAKLIATL